ncbi:hypothetical protein H4R33_001588 [Dimargaris cristalligena]|nr:hypothetical protein H4R33_001588 [Dimargaris cristalligena]
MHSHDRDDFDVEQSPKVKGLKHSGRLPGELMQKIAVDSSPLTRHHLSQLSKEYQSYALNADYKLTQELYDSLKTALALAEDSQSSEPYKVFQAWNQLVAQPLAANLFLNAVSSWDPTVGLIKRSSRNPNHFIPRKVVSDFYQYLLSNQNNPFFQPAAATWQYINTKTLPPPILASRFPLLALVDQQNDGKELLEMFNILGTSSLKVLSSRESCPPKELEKVDQIRRKIFPDPILLDTDSPNQPAIAPVAFTTDLPKWLDGLILNIIPMIMTRLSTELRFKELLDFMAGLKLWLERTYPEHDKGLRIYHSFNQFAVLLAAVAQQPEWLTEFTKVYIDPSSGIAANDLRKAQWELVNIMKMINLPNGAGFLASQWELAQPSEGIQKTDSGSNVGASPDFLANEEIAEDADSYDEFNDLPIITHIHLTDDNQMGLLAYMPNFDRDELPLVSNMGPGATNYLSLDLFSESLKPEYLEQLEVVLDTPVTSNTGSEDYVGIYNILNPS